VQLLLASDLHYQLRQLDWLVEQAARFDVVVLAGDHLDISGGVALESQSVVIVRYLQRLAERSNVIAASGNHDLTARNQHGEKEAAWLAEGRDVGAKVDWDTVDITGDVDGVRITVCPWWDGPATREDVITRLRADAQDRPAKWVWVYHPPPSGSPTAQSAKREYGDDDLRAWIDELQPDIVLTGHVHDAPFVQNGSWRDHTGSTWTFNAGRTSMGAIPNHVILDFDARTASWYGGGESDAISLDQVA
jgi:Icc-related predicted phosphoesterase